VLRDIEEDPTLKEQFEAWSADRARFISELKTPDSDAAKERWQKYYYRGLDSAGNPASTEGHRTRIRLKPFSRQD
jgi:hypothetical protein